MKKNDHTEQSTQDKLVQLKANLKSMGRVAVAFSGGVDSTFLLKVAQDVLGDNVIAVTAKPYSFPDRELEEAKTFCREMGIRHFIFEFNEMEIDGFSENQPNRCYLCKREIFERIEEIAREQEISYIAEGSNMDDDGDYRPGLMAVSELGIKSPLRQAGLYKEEIRDLSKELELSTWEKPSFACLSSRFPYGEEIMAEKLSMIDRSEQLLFDKGFRQVRVRIHGRMARIEVSPEELEKLIEKDTREEIVSKLKSYGFAYVSIDLEGYRTGSMNESLREGTVKKDPEKLEKSYDFDTKVNRRGSASLKWDVLEHELPMWVADMDFQTAPEIREAVSKRAEHGIFGYMILPDAWYEAYQNWWQQYHGFRIEKEWLIFCTGVVPAISSAVRKLTTPGENVLIQTPVYNIFFNSIINNGRNVVESPLDYDNQKYSIDFGRLEKDLSDPQTSLMILCNPHNPVGKIWDRDTLAKIGELCARYHVTVLSDEIHCDLTAPELDYVPFASVSETCRDISITAIAPTKAFNLAGLQTAAIVVPDKTLRHKMWRALNTDEVAEPNAFAVDAAVAAFTKGRPWLEELRRYVQENKSFVQRFIQRELPQLSIVSMDATYLLWIDCSKLPGTSSEFARFLRETTGLYVSAGKEYGGNGNRFVRMNVACPREYVRDGMERLMQGVRRFPE